MNKSKVLFIKKSGTASKFVLNDLEIIQEKYAVSSYDFKISNNIFIVAALTKQFFYLLFNIWRYKLVYIWFADYYSFLPVLFAGIFGKKSIICVGGYECTYIPEIGIGVFTKASFSKRIRAFCVTYSLKNCSMILPVDGTLVENVNTYIYSDTPEKEPLHDGMKTFIPGLKTEIETIHLGFDSEVFKKKQSIAKEKSVVSAGLIVNENEFKRKGFDLLVEAAGRMKDVKFVLIGLNEEYYNKLSELKLDNLELLKITSYERLIEEYSKAKVFAQISMFEGMPSTICEAMLCECIPVGSNVNGIPKIIDGTGFIVNKKDINEVVETLYKALNSPADFGVRARQQILANFPIEKRTTKLLKNN